MKIKSHKQKSAMGAKGQMALAFLALVLLVAVAMSAFLRFYYSYNDRLLYTERLSQMQEVTVQLFSGMEDIINVQWENAKYQCNYLEKEAPETVDELLAFMQDQASMEELDKKQSDLIAIDTQGRYYYPDGKQGLMYDMSYLEDKPERISYVFNEMTTSRTRMMFLYRLDKPVTVQDGKRTNEIFYYGLAEDMDVLNPYFDCEAYDGNNSTYVLDDQGLKLFSGSNNRNLLSGFNIFSVLRGMDYLHDFSFDDALATLQKEGLAYSNAILDDEEYYYAMYQMDNSEWILLFLVPSRYVATNTVQLVNTTTNLLLAFAVFMALICAALIYMVLRVQQKKALRVADETNAMLEAKNEQLELAQIATTRALKIAEAASKAKTDFLSNMSHDIRTPMNAIVGITKLMAHDKDDPVKIEGYIGKVQQSSQHLLSLINDVLDMSKIESGEVTLNREPVSLADQIWQVESIVRPQVEEHGQKFVVRTHKIVHEYLTGDAVRLRQVFINLLSNAIKYTPYGGSILLELEELPCEIPYRARFRISVTDSGYGMTPEFTQHIFEPFTRAENSTTNRIQGTGLGMAITKNIVDLAGGTISVQSKINEGSCFRVELPLLIDTSVKTEIPIHNALLIADEKMLIDNAMAATQEADFTLYVARTKEEAGDLLRQKQMDLVLLGSRLNGELLADNLDRIRAKTGDALLFYCCDYEEKDQLADIMEKGGVDGVLVRPFFLSGLAAAIERAHGKTSEDTAENLSDLKGLRFLCAEDNALNAEILQAVLDMNGADCVIYPDGKKLVEAFASVKPGDYDAILMDVQMPVMNGLDAARAIRRSENPLGRTIPIVAMTANAFSEDVQHCLDAGMDAHVSKPLDFAGLARTLKTVMHEKTS